MHIGERIKAAREARNWSQHDLARKSGVTQGTISKLELGQRRTPSGAILEKLAHALGLTVDDLLHANGSAPAEEGRLEAWVQEMVALAPTLSPTDRAALLHTARAMQKAHS